MAGLWASSVLVLFEGAVLLTENADRLGDASGPKMIGYSVVMALDQALLGTRMMDDGSGMGLSSGMGGPTMTAGMGWDAGMVTLAVFELVSGLIIFPGNRTESGSAMLKSAADTKIADGLGAIFRPGV